VQANQTTQGNKFTKSKKESDTFFFQPVGSLFGDK
jgi:hypothetical protein